MSLESADNQPNNLTIITQSHGILCPCGSCRTMFSGMAGSSLPVLANSTSSSSDTAVRTLIAPKVRAKADSIGLAPHTQATITRECIAAYGIDGPAVEAAIVAKLSLEPSSHRIIEVERLNELP